MRVALILLILSFCSILNAVEIGPCEVTARTPEGYLTICEIDRSAGLIISGSQAVVGDLVYFFGEMDSRTGIFAVTAEEIVAKSDIAPLAMDTEKVYNPTGLDITGLKIMTPDLAFRERLVLLVPYRLEGAWHYVVLGTYDENGMLIK